MRGKQSPGPDQHVDSVAWDDDAPAEPDDRFTCIPKTQHVGAASGNVFLKATKPRFVASTADGSKFFECSTQKGVFKRLAAGDLLILTQIKSGCAVVAVGVVAHAAVCQETRRSELRRMLPRSLHGKLEEYLGQKKNIRLLAE